MDPTDVISLTTGEPRPRSMPRLASAVCLYHRRHIIAVSYVGNEKKTFRPTSPGRLFSIRRHRYETVASSLYNITQVLFFNTYDQCEDGRVLCVQTPTGNSTQPFDFRLHLHYKKKSIMSIICQYIVVNFFGRVLDTYDMLDKKKFNPEISFSLSMRRFKQIERVLNARQNTCVKKKV